MGAPDPRLSASAPAPADRPVPRVSGGRPALRVLRHACMNLLAGLSRLGCPRGRLAAGGEPMPRTRRPLPATLARRQAVAAAVRALGGDVYGTACWFRKLCSQSFRKLWDTPLGPGPGPRGGTRRVRRARTEGVVGPGDDRSPQATRSPGSPAGRVQRATGRSASRARQTVQRIGSEAPVVAIDDPHLRALKPVGRPSTVAAYRADVEALLDANHDVATHEVLRLLRLKGYAGGKRRSTSWSRELRPPSIRRRSCASRAWRGSSASTTSDRSQ